MNVRDMALFGLCLAAMSCTLPAFNKVDDEPRKPVPDAGAEPVGPLCVNLDLKLGRACGSCVAEHCCAEAAKCLNGACGDDIRLPLSPLTKVTDEFDDLAACMLQNCDTEDTCDVRWGCVGNYSWPPTKEAHVFSMRVFNYADPAERGIPNINVRLCEGTDPGCSEDGGYVTTSKTDSTGRADFTVEKGFNGYFQLSGGGPMPATVQWNQPAYDVVESFSHQSLAQMAVQGIATKVGLHQTTEEPFEPNTGHLIARMQNCLPLKYLDVEDPARTARARDVVFRFTPDTGASQVFYINEAGGVDVTQKSTTWRGYGGAFEVPPVNVTVTANHAETGKLLANGTLTIRDGTIGFMYLVPNPRP